MRITRSLLVGQAGHPDGVSVRLVGGDLHSSGDRPGQRPQRLDKPWQLMAFCSRQAGVFDEIR